MTTPWQTEDEEVKMLVGEDWDIMSVAERAIKAKESGLEGKLGAKLWDDLTPRERATIQDPGKRPVMLDYQTKAHVVLEDSDKENWGMVREMDFDWSSAGGDLVGNWSRSLADGLFHVFLETPLAALVDKAVVRFAEHAERRKAAESAPKGKARAPRVPKEILETAAEQDLKKINSLRSLLKK